MASGDDPRPQLVSWRARGLDSHLHTSSNPPPGIQASLLSCTVKTSAHLIVRSSEDFCSEAGSAKAGKSIQASKMCLELL